jgi:hypothetical protein
MEKLFGDLKLARSDGTTASVTEIVAGKQHCLLFFGAKWAEPCESCFGPANPVPPPAQPHPPPLPPALQP